ncbi:hypothetical protein ACFHYQ_24450 [Sphaerimonospora cavernae]|uniref:Uncharacterized protein n=1 Tax=Sphaerimonospora cavernae TaxID=1740611 RepID=A0ABV6UBA3_9ACTN
MGSRLIRGAAVLAGSMLAVGALTPSLAALALTAQKDSAYAWTAANGVVKLTNNS